MVNMIHTLVQQYNIFFTVLTIGFAAPSYSGSEGGFVQPVVRIISGMLSVGLTASVRFSTVDGVAVGKLYVCMCKILHAHSSTAPDDYNTTVHILQFTSTSQNMTVPVPLRTDGLFEAREMFIAELVAVTSAFSIAINPQRTNLFINDTNSEAKSAIMQRC